MTQNDLRTKIEETVDQVGDYITPRAVDQLLKLIEEDRDKEKDFIFVCAKCGHNLYVERARIQKLLKMDCPNCGEDYYDLWKLSGRGKLND